MPDLLTTTGRLCSDVAVQQTKLVIKHAPHQLTDIATGAFLGIHHIGDVRIIEQIVVAGLRKTCGTLGEDILVAVE